MAGGRFIERATGRGSFVSEGARAAAVAMMQPSLRIMLLGFWRFVLRSAGMLDQFCVIYALLRRASVWVACCGYPRASRLASTPSCCAPPSSSTSSRKASLAVLIGAGTGSSPTDDSICLLNPALSGPRLKLFSIWLGVCSQP